jgi:hypothetical protein
MNFACGSSQFLASYAEFPQTDENRIKGCREVFGYRHGKILRAAHRHTHKGEGDSQFSFAERASCGKTCLGRNAQACAVVIRNRLLDSGCRYFRAATDARGGGDWIDRLMDRCGVNRDALFRENRPACWRSSQCFPASRGIMFTERRQSPFHGFEDQRNGRFHR